MKSCKKLFVIITIFTIHVSLLSAQKFEQPKNEDQAKILFSQAAKGSSLSLSVHNDITEIDNTFFRTDKVGNTYFIAKDSIQERYEITRLAPDGQLTHFPAKEFTEDGYYRILHLDVSADGRWIFIEEFEAYSKTPYVICIDTENQNKYKTLIELKGNLHWRTSSLVYSDANETLYFHTYSNGQEIKGIDVQYDYGYYICRKTNNLFTAEGVSHKLNLPPWMISDARRAFLLSSNPDYKGFLDWLYHYADTKDCIFAYPDENDELLTEEAALNYILKNNLFEDNLLFLKKTVLRTEGGKITEDSAITIDSNYIPSLPVNLMNAPSHSWFLKTEEGIWCMNETGVQVIDKDGNATWKCGYILPFYVEDKEGNAPSPSENPLTSILIKAPVDEGKQTALVYNGTLIIKIKDTENWTVCKANELTSFTSLQEAKFFIETGEIIRADESFVSRKDFSAYLFLIILISALALFELGIIIFILTPEFKKQLSKKEKKRVFAIQEAERTKLSRDIHDSVVQNIRAIRLEAEMLQVNAENEDKKQKIINEMTDVIALLRNICYNFRPAELSVETDTAEIISIIDTLCQQFIARTKIPCQIQIQKDFTPPQMDTEKSTNIVRAVQEALSNIEKHSYATSVQILIKGEGDESEKCEKSLVIFVIDDGVGCDINKIGKNKMHFGIRNMKERIAAAGGRTEFFSTPGEGLSVQFVIPYNCQSKGEDC
ncbi:MAG: sensor histidine kinase [Treponema sp.]|nr:sensor histidine kinase [Treponema sp.]